MIDPKEKSAHEQEEQDAARDQSSGNENSTGENNTGENTNWNEHQQVDEEGNEVGPDDIK